MASEPRICDEGGGGLLLPLWSQENRLNKSARAIGYLAILGWCFLGVSIVADTFMGAIEAVTSKKKIVRLGQGRSFPAAVWNPTVANLTLMALGSSAPEILLSVIELLGASFHSGELGPSTIVGSAAFNLMIIIAVCVVVIPDGEKRTIKAMPVFCVSGTCSIFAYLWLIFILAVASPDLVEPWEGVFTFLFFPLLVLIAYLADIGKLGGLQDDDFIIGKLQEEGHHLDKKQAKALRQSTEFDTKKSRAARRLEVSPAHFLRLQGSGATEAPEDGPPIGFVTGVYCFSNGLAELPLEVEKYGDEAERIAFEFTTRDGSMKGDKGNYTSSRDLVEIPAGERKGSIVVHRIAGPIEEQQGEVSWSSLPTNGAPPDKDNYFWVEITQAWIMGPQATLSHLSAKNATCFSMDVTKSRAQVQITDQEVQGGRLRFKASELSHLPDPERQTRLKVVVERFNGSVGELTCNYRTEAASAQDGGDFIHAEGELVFHDGEMQKDFEVLICPKSKWESQDRFFIHLEAEDNMVAATTSKAQSRRQTALQNPNEWTCSVNILAGSTDHSAAVRMCRKLDSKLNFDAIMTGNVMWQAQMKAALKPTLDDDDDEASVKDWAIHFVALPWKLLFALIPPPPYFQGWLCFGIALVFIGFVTAIIGDLASLAGCCLGIPDSITAITIVALGTSLPDTFASKAAAVGDEWADNAIGNVTGSNSVNVFLGLGLPWMIASIYWAAQGATPEWIARYPAQAAEYPNGGFIVVAGDLTFSVVIFCLCAISCLMTIVFRRKAYQAELGGPPGMKVNTAIFFVALWVLYISLASWKALAGDVSGGTQVMATFVGIIGVLFGMAVVGLLMQVCQQRSRTRAREQQDMEELIREEICTQSLGLKPMQQQLLVPKVHSGLAPPPVPMSIAALQGGVVPRSASSLKPGKLWSGRSGGSVVGLSEAIRVPSAPPDDMRIAMKELWAHVGQLKAFTNGLEELLQRRQAAADQEDQVAHEVSVDSVEASEDGQSEAPPHGNSDTSIPSVREAKPPEKPKQKKKVSIGARKKDPQTSKRPTPSMEQVQEGDKEE